MQQKKSEFIVEKIKNFLFIWGYVFILLLSIGSVILFVILPIRIFLEYRELEFFQPMNFNIRFFFGILLSSLFLSLFLWIWAELQES